MAGMPNIWEKLYTGKYNLIVLDRSGCWMTRFKAFWAWKNEIWRDKVIEITGSKAAFLDMAALICRILPNWIKMYKKIFTLTYKDIWSDRLRDTAQIHHTTIIWDIKIPKVIRLFSISHCIIYEEGSEMIEIRPRIHCQLHGSINHHAETHTVDYGL